MPFRKDLISVMKSCGGIPESSMESYVNTIKERDRFELKAREQDLMLTKALEEKSKAQEENAKAQEKIDELMAA